MEKELKLRGTSIATREKQVPVGSILRVNRYNDKRGFTAEVQLHLSGEILFTNGKKLQMKHLGDFDKVFLVSVPLEKSPEYVKGMEKVRKQANAIIDKAQGEANLIMKKAHEEVDRVLDEGHNELLKKLRPASLCTKYTPSTFTESEHATKGCIGCFVEVSSHFEPVPATFQAVTADGTRFIVDVNGELKRVTNVFIKDKE